MTISLLCPTRGRPEQFKRMCESVQKTSSNPVEIYFYQSTSDNTSYDCPTGSSHIKKCIGPDWPTVHSWNWLAENAAGNKLFMLAADDMIFSTIGWDTALLDHYNALENKIHVYALQDSRDINGTPHPIVTREYMDAMGYFMPPIFLHWFVDSWTVDIARANNCFTHLKDYELVHDKPSDKGQADETHNRIRCNGWWERDSYVNATCQHFLELEKQRLRKEITK